MNWSTIESDPGVFTSLIQSFGTTGVEVSEIWGLDDACLPQQSYGLIFLFKWIGNKGDDNKQEEKGGNDSQDNNQEFPKMIPGPVLSETYPSLFFANQTVMNACATQAILSIVLNITPPSTLPTFTLGPTLTSFKEFTMPLDPMLRGDVVGSNDVIREAHNAFTRNDPFVSEGNNDKGGKKEDVYHFISYVSSSGLVWELDGLKSGPTAVGVSGDDWVKVARDRVQERIKKYGEGEVMFNLMSLGEDKREVIKREISNVTDERQREVLREDLQGEELKREKWEIENGRRRHNWIPFINGDRKSVV